MKRALILQNPNIQLATLFERIRGQVIDTVIGIIPIAIAAILYIVSDQLGNWLMYIAIPYLFLYIIFADGLRGGQSYGKRIVGTAVVDAKTGKPCTYFQSFVRNILLSFLGILDWVWVLGGRRQRLGDLAARTIVIRNK